MDMEISIEMENNLSGDSKSFGIQENNKHEEEIDNKEERNRPDWKYLNESILSLIRNNVMKIVGSYNSSKFVVISV